MLEAKTKQLAPVHLDLPLVWKWPLCNLRSNMADFVPCDQIVRRAYYRKLSIVE